MAQAATADTDELLSQLAASEIDRLLSEADAEPAPVAAPVEKAATESVTPSTSAAEASPSSVDAAPLSSTTTEGTERAALLQAAGFDSTPAAVAPAVSEPAAPAVQAAVEDERSALLQAAGFDSPEDLGFNPKNAPSKSSDPNYVPIYLKPLVWLNSPLDSCPVVVRQAMGKVGLVTLFNALAVLTYVVFFRKH